MPIDMCMAQLCVSCDNLLMLDAEFCRKCGKKVSAHMHRHAYRHVYRHVYRNMYRHINMSIHVPNAELCLQCVE